MTDIAIFLPSPLAVLGVIAALNLTALAIFMRRARFALLQSSIPAFLLVAPVVPLGLVSDMLLTGAVAGLVFVAFGAAIPGVICLALTVAAFFAFGSFRAQLLLSGLLGLLRGHEAAVGSLAFFDALRAQWRPRRLLSGAASALVVCTIDLAAITVLLASFVVPGVVAVVALTASLRLLGSVLLVPFALIETTVTVAEPVKEQEPASWREDLAA